MAMRILIDARPIYGTKSGVGYYLFHLLEALGQIDTKNRYTLQYVSGHADPDQILQLPYPNFETRVLRFPNKVFLHLFQDSLPPYHLARALSRGYDLVHEASLAALPLAPRAIVTIHDMLFFRRSQDHAPAFAARYRRRLVESAHNASVILADSEQTRRDILELLDVPLAKVRTVLLGVSPNAFVAPDSVEADESLHGLGINGPFLLSIGDLYRRKNNVTLVRAFARLSDELRRTHRLVIAGAEKDVDVMRELRAEIAGARLEESVLLTGYVSEAARKVLMARAAALCYPTLYEGFGLPPLEAMAARVPTASSDNSSIPEVVGDAGLLIQDYEDPDAWAAAMTRLLTDAALRAQLIEAGLARARLFTWERTAQETLRAYEAALG